MPPGAPSRIHQLLRRRALLFEELWERQVEAHKVREFPAEVALAGGRTVPVTAWCSTPLDVARSISPQLPGKVFVAAVDGELWDLTRPFEGDVQRFELLGWDAPQARTTFWHSSAHVLGGAMEEALGTYLSTGPPLPDAGGFFYEGETPSPVSEADFPALTAVARGFTAARHPFQRLVVCKDDALEMFRGNPFKEATLHEKVPDGGSCTVYRCGGLVDPCRGPHLPDAGRVKCFEIRKSSSAYWRGKDANPVLQRVYGISFPKDSLMKEWKELAAAAARNDHRKVGARQGLWTFHDASPGSCFWFPPGAHIYNTLMTWLRTLYRKKGFEEVITPNMFHKKLWETSGHWQKYAGDMFKVGEKEEFAVKPMNCPGHCLMYAQSRRSYRELPIRYADFGVLHRNELAGALTGLTRVRRFCQDDGHIFCLPEQVEEEIEASLAFLDEVYGVLGFKYSLALSTRPEAMLGTHEMWDVAEQKLADALNRFCRIPESKVYDGSEDAVRCLKRAAAAAAKEGKPLDIRQLWTRNEGDGAFYGPKIDIQIEDCMKRRHQLGTLQLDFNLPERFDLRYETGGVDATASSAAPARPVMIHRAILGSLERCIAILAEHWKGQWPFWISPRQAVVIPVSEAHLAYAKQVRDKLYGEGYQVTVDTSDATLNKKIRNGQLDQYNFILVVGAEEADKGTVAVRLRGTQGKGSGRCEKTLEEVLSWFEELKRTQDPDY